MGVINDIKRCETLMQKLQEIITALRQLFRYAKSSATAGLFVIVGRWLAAAVF